MTVLLSLAVLTLFTPFRLSTGLVYLRPFDALAFLMLGLALARGRVFPRRGIQVGVVALLPYFVWHVLSALSVGVENGAREGLQVATVLAFTWALAVSADDLDFRLAGRLLLGGMVAVTMFSVGWHLAHGYWSGWKRLVDPKATFTFLPMVLGCLIAVAAKGRRGVLWLGWGLLGVTILLSGERKALLVYAILTAGLLAHGRVLFALHMTAAAFVALVLLSSLVNDPYLSRQISSVVDPADAGDYSTAIATGEAARGDSRSNAQRAFAASLAGTLIEQHLLFGIGTNRYQQIVEERFAFVPAFLRDGIHGEFLRVLTENGLIGLVSYLLVWIAAIVRTRAVLLQAAARRLITGGQATMLQLIAFVPGGMYVAFEASGTHSLIVLVILSLFADLLTGWMGADDTPFVALPLRPGPGTVLATPPAMVRGLS
jgi:hypothetical protein